MSDDLKTSPIFKTPCPYCGAALGFATSMEGYTPEEDCATFCGECGGTLRFTRELAVRKPTDQERAADLRNPEFQKLIAGWKILHRINEAERARKAGRLN